MNQHLFAIAALFACAVLFGCDSSKNARTDDEAPAEQTAPETPTETNGETGPDDTLVFPTNAMECSDASAASTRRFLSTYFAWRRNVVFSDVKSVVRDTSSSPTFDDPIILELQGDTVHIADKEPGKPLGEISDVLAGALARDKREAQLLGREWQHPGVTLAIAPDTRWTNVVRVAEAVVNSGSSHVEFAFEHPRPDTLGEVPPELQKQLRAYLRHTGFNKPAEPLDPVIAKRHEEQLGDCDAMKALHGELESLHPRERETKLSEELGSIWVQCECEPDIEWIVARQLFHAPGTPLGRVAVEVDPAGSTVVRPADTPWEEAYQAVLQSEQPVALVVAQ